MTQGTNAKSSERVGVLLLHGLCGTPSELRYIANGLTRMGATVSCPTLAGHCSTREALSATTWQDWYKSAEDALLELKKTCSTVVVGGLSTGAVLALVLAAKRPELVSGLTLYSPTIWLTGAGIPWYLPLLRHVVTRDIASRFDLPAPAHLGIKDARIREFLRKALSTSGEGEASVRVTPGAAAYERGQLAKQAIALLPSITQPVLIVHARDDDYAGLDNPAYLERTLKGSVELAILEDSYHVVTLDRQRDVVLERTETFITRLLAGAAKRKARAAAQAPVKAPAHVAMSVAAALGAARPAHAASLSAA